MCFLILSGAATGASWLCYFKALQLGTVNQVVPIDKSSTVLTILLALIFLQEGVSLPKLLAALTIGVGIFLMIERKNEEEGKTGGKGWMIYAWGSAFFASLTSILGKIGISGVESNLGTAIRTGVVLVMAWLVVLAAGATGASWLCYYRALQLGPASAVAPVDKLSILVTTAFSYLVFGERLSGRSAAGLALLTAGTVLMAVV